MASEKSRAWSPDDRRYARAARKRAELMDAAQRVFIEKGFERASMDAIAIEAGISKMTVYRNFDSKESLFVACMNEQCAEMLVPNRYSPSSDLQTVRKNLVEYGKTLVELVSVKSVSTLYRLLIGEVGHFPGLGQIFYDSGPMHAGEIVEGILADLFEPADRRMRAYAFIWTALGDTFQRITLGICEFEDVKEQMHDQVAFAADLILK